MTKTRNRRFMHTDIDLMRARMKLTPSQRLQSMIDAHALLIGIMRGRLRVQYPELSDREVNLKVIEEIERAKLLPSRSSAATTPLQCLAATGEPLEP